MRRKMKISSMIGTCTLLFLSSQAFGASVSLMGTQIGGGFGNSLDTLASDGTTTVTASAWSFDGAWSTSQLRRFGSGLGVCNQGEGTGCPTSFGEHATDNNVGDQAGSRIDFVLLQFDSQVMLEAGTLTYWSTDGVDDADRDITYWSGLGGPDFSNGLNNLTNRVNRDLALRNGNGFAETVDFSALASPVDWLLIGARAGDLAETIDVNGSLGLIIEDAIKVKAIEFTSAPAIPIPPVAILFGTGLAGLISLAKRRGLIKNA